MQATDEQPRPRRVVIPPGLVAFAGVVAVTGVVVAALGLAAVWDEAINAWSLGAYWAAAALGWLVLTTMWRVLDGRERAGLGRRGGRDFAKAATIVLLLAAGARVAVALSGPPVLSDDLWRYVHDGATLGLAGENPYAQSPAETDPDFLGNHPEMVTIYQPVSQWVFAGLAAVAWQTPGATADTLFRLGFSMLDLMVVGLLMAALWRRGRSAWWASLYAWHPLAITEVAGAGHQEPLGIALLLTGMLLADAVGDNLRGVRRLAGATGCGGAVAAAVAVKPVVAPIAIFIACRWWRRGGGTSSASVIALAGMAGGAVLVAAYLPFALMPGGLDRMFETVATFTQNWRFNGSLHPLLEAVTGSKAVSDGVLGLALLAAVGAIAWRVRDAWQAAGAYLLVALLLTSTVHPWYVLWPLALVPLSRGAGVWVFSLTATWAYAAWLNDSAFQPPMWLRVLEYVPVYAAAAWSLWYTRYGGNRSTPALR